MPKRKKGKSPSSGKSAQATRPHYNIDYVRSAARGQWAAILSQLGGIPSELLDGRHHPCPKCGGTDRFRLIDVDAGAILCNQCAPPTAGIGDGFASLAWMLGRKFADVLPSVAEWLGIEPEDGDGYRSNGHGRGGTPADPAEHLEFQPWDESTELLASYWCLAKPPITLSAIRAVGGQVARYRGQYTVIALPVHGEARFQPGGESAKPVGWSLYNITGGLLPKFSRAAAGQPAKIDWVKVKLTFGSSPGIITDLSRLQSAVSVDAWKVEGPSDLLAALSFPDLPPNSPGPAPIILTNANGAKENPPAWVLSLFTGHRGRCLHDADKPGQLGAIGWTDERSGRKHVGWAPAIASIAADARNVVLPYPIADDHGPDLRDFANSGRTYADLLALAELAAVIPQQPIDPPEPQPLEEADDPHRLARANIARYSDETNGGRIVYWREEWYTWKPARGCYRIIKEKEFQAKITASIKAEFNRLWQEDTARYEEKTKQADYDWDSDKGPPKARRVTRSLVANVLSATASLVCLPASIELMTWIGDPSNPAPPPARERRPYIAVSNGVIDLERLLADAEESECVLPLSPNWFSTVRLPYAFDPAAKCPKWEAFLERNLQLDPERIKIVQEWAGYCLTTDSGQQKFLALEGEGSNGKSVFCAGLTAMLGADNCSHLGLESFGPDFDKADMIGKLVNICADVGEVDKLAEGHLKSFTSGDVVHFKRKHISGISCIPTARLIISFNNRPRFSDRSFGIWRRMLLIPWLVEIGERDRIPNMDKAWWWEKQGELPGMFNWALIGLSRLRAQGRFTDSAIGREALDDYRDESNPARAFLREHFQESETSSIRCSLVYHFYCKWCTQTGHKPFGDRVFGREIKRVFKKSERKRVRNGESLRWSYFNLAFAQNEICGERIEPDMMF
jgi:P4 family phage/plasmid primase-like protien